MSKDSSSQQFRSNGKLYTFQATLRSLDDEVQVPLDNAALLSFEYESELNGLVLHGSLEYEDAYGNVDKLLEKQGAYLDVVLVEDEQEFDGALTIESVSDVSRFCGTFLVESIGITDRRAERISYRMELVSSNAYRCQQTVDYSTYSNGQQTVFDILKACLEEAGIETDRDSFDAVKTSVRLDYITNGNDCVLTIAKYLMSKLYYYSEKDDSLKFFFWNETTSKAQLFDVKSKDSATGSYSVILSLLKSRRESMTEEEPAKLATITRWPASANLRAMFSAQVADYSYDDNKFETRSVTSQALANYFNATYDSETRLLPKQQPADKQSGLNCLRRGAYWNNDLNWYGEMVRSFLKSNALLVETSGEILRKPGAFMNVVVDRDVSEIASEDPERLEDMMTRYRGLEGAWFVSRVHHLVCPRENRYRQWLALVRNYTVDLENKESS